MSSLFALGVALALAVAVVAALGIASTRSAEARGSAIADNELTSAVLTGQLAQSMDAAYQAGQAAIQAGPAMRSDLLTSLYTSLLPRVDGRIVKLDQLHASDPPAELAYIESFGRQWAAVRNLLSPEYMSVPAGSTAATAELASAYAPITAQLSQLYTSSLSDAQADRAGTAAQTDRATWLIAGVAALGLAVGALLAGRGVRRIRESLVPSEDHAEFADTLQIAGDEEEAHLLLQRHLERSLPDTSAVVLNRNNSADRLEAVTPLPAGSPLPSTLRGAEPRSCLAVRSGRTHREDGRSALLTCSVCAPAPGTSCCVPLTVGGEVIGSVLVSRPAPYSEGEEQRISESVRQAAPVLANLRNLAVAEIRASTDGLTGLPNKRAVNDAMKRTFAQAATTQSPLALMLLDLDHFKQVNDQRGHAVGDQVLASVGATLRGVLRAGDFAGRNGGEEFAVLLPDTSIPDALDIAERVRSAIAEISLAGTDVSVTASIGVAVFPDQVSTLDRLERLADAALYTAKRQGRNRIELAESSPAPVPEPRASVNTVPLLPQASHGPQIGEGGRGQGGAQVGRAGRAAGAPVTADGPLHHLDVVIAPFLHALVQVDQQLAHRRRVGVVVVDLLQRLLHRVRGLQRRRDVAPGDLGGHVVALPGQVAGERVEDRRARHRGRDALPLGPGQRRRRQHLGVPAAEHRLELAELRRLEPAGGAEPVAEPGELGGRHGLEHVELGDHDLQDGQRPPQRAHGVRGAAGLELGLELAQLVQQLLEPQLVDLVDDDEQHLVVLGRPGLLR